MRRIVQLLALVLCACPKEAPPAVVDAGAPDVFAVIGEVAPDLKTGCAEYAKAMCAAFDRCNPDGTPVLFGDVPACEKKIERECLLEEQLPGTGVTNASLQKCALAVATRTCPVDREDPDCVSPSGTHAIGQTCVGADQCTSRNCEFKGFTDACGVCAAAHPAAPRTSSTQQAAGGACKDDDDCKTGFGCESHKCRKATPRKDGESCTASIIGFARGLEPCGPGLTCGTDKKCHRRPVEGDACTPFGMACVFPLRCHDGRCSAPSPAACVR